MTKIISFEGIIGAGKSTTIEYCTNELVKKGFTVYTVKENVDEWVKDGILQKFYDDPKRYAYHFQTKAFIDKVQSIKNAYDNYFGNVDFIITERSLVSDYIFAKLLYNDKYMDDMEFKHYEDWYEFWKYLLPNYEYITVYLKLNTNIALDRIKKRGRDGENHITCEYETKLMNMHDEYFDNAKIVWDSTKNIHEKNNVDELVNLLLTVN